MKFVNVILIPPLLLLVLGIHFCSVVSVAAADWPTYMQNNARSGVTESSLELPLQKHWAYHSPAPLKPAWPPPQKEHNELPKLDFDYAVYTVAAGDTLYFGSPVDNAVYAVDAATGRRRWRFFTGAPVRLSPTVAGGRVYAGADDGFVYCLNAEDGVLLWRSHGAATPPRPVLGSGRVMALSPVRTGVLLRDGKAWFGTGVFPHLEVRLQAVDAVSGELLWQVDPETERMDLSPQGHLLASESLLFIPSGRQMPAACNLNDGVFHDRSTSARDWKVKVDRGAISGSYGLVKGDKLLFGSQNTVYEISYAGGGLIAEKRYNQTDRMLFKGDAVFQLRGQRSPKRPVDTVTHIVRVDNAGQQSATGEQNTVWSYEQPGLVSMILAGNTLIAGGENTVTAIDAGSGRELWRAALDGAALGLTVAAGRLFVSTDKGDIYGFASGSVPGLPAVGIGEIDIQDAASGVMSLAASLLQNTELSKGYAVVLGADAFNLSAALVQSSELAVYCLLPAEADIAQAREKLATAGIYGSRLTVFEYNSGALPLPDYMANLIVDAGAAGTDPTPDAELLRVLKPCGGVLFRRQPLPEAWADSGVLAADVRLADDSKGWFRFERGILAGSGWWSSDRADPGNTGSSEDEIVRHPLELLWYGEPGSGEVPDRKFRGMPPLIRNGRVVCQGYSHADGRNYLISFDAYNGIRYWERDLDGSARQNMSVDSGNMVINSQNIFVSAGRKTHQFDLYTGAPVATYDAAELGAHADTHAWAYLMVTDDMLIGSTAASAEAGFSRNLFALNLKTGRRAWLYQGRIIRNTTIAVLDDRLIFLEDRNPEADSTAPPADPGIRRRRGLPVDDADSAVIRNVTALSLKNGNELWTRKLDVASCGYWTSGFGNLYGIGKQGVYVVCGAFTQYGRQKGKETRHAIALAAADGGKLWKEAVANASMPIIIGDALLAEPFFFNLNSGSKIMKENARGKLQPWSIGNRPGGLCGTITASAAMLFFRSGMAAWHDIEAEKRTHFLGVRPGCWANMIAAGGVLVQAEASSGCSCYYSLQATFVFK